MSPRDGEKFSEAAMGGDVAAQPVANPQPSSSGKAIGSLVCGILGLFILGVILGPVAIVLGLQARREIQERPDALKGECMAVSGLVIGIIGFVGSIIIIITLAAN